MGREHQNSLHDRSTRKRVGFLLFGMKELGLGKLNDNSNKASGMDDMQSLSSKSSDESAYQRDLQEAEKKLGEQEGEIARLRRELRVKDHNTKKELVTMKRNLKDKEK